MRASFDNTHLSSQHEKQRPTRYHHVDLIADLHSEFQVNQDNNVRPTPKKLKLEFKPT